MATSRPQSPPLLAARQAGGTLLGFVLGLLVGIGAALAVAVYVTKVPIPLVDRGVQRKPMQPDTEAERLRDWNPNAGLSRTAPPAAAPAPEAPAAAPDTAASAPAPAGEGKAPAGDPIAELIRQRTTPTAASPSSEDKPAAADPFQYYVQVGAFRQAEEAEAQRARLALQGFSAKVSEREQAGQRVYRVRLGPFDNKVDAEVMQERLRGLQIETALVRVQR
jgi:cell division protein FtsN